MTVKEIAQFTGKNELTVQRWVSKCKMQSAVCKLQSFCMC